MTLEQLAEHYSSMTVRGQLVRSLAKGYPNAVTKQQLIIDVYGAHAVHVMSDDALRSIIAKLRTRISKLGWAIAYASKWRGGYKLEQIVQPRTPIQDHTSADLSNR